MFARRFAAAFCLFFCLVLLSVPAGCGGCAHHMVMVHDDVSHYMVCVECGESSAPQSHTLLRVQLTETSCTETGVALLQCACGYSETEETPPSGHDFGAWLPNEDGAHMRICSICDEIETEEHAFSDGFCSLCGAKQAADDPHPDFGEGGEHVHTYGEWVTLTPASCNVAGRRVRYCSGCGTLQSEAIPALTHDFGEWEAEEPSSCELPLIEHRTCSLCGETETRYLPSDGHAFGEWTTVQSAACEREGIEIRVCAFCGAEERHVIAALEHKFGEWKVIQPASCGVAGVCGGSVLSAEMSRLPLFQLWMSINSAIGK